MREIAEACGITKAALYYHFDGKPDLLNAIFVSYLAEIAGGGRGQRRPRHRAEPRLRWLVEQLFALPPEQRAIMRLAMHEVGQLQPEQRAAFAADYRARFIGPLQQIVARARRAATSRRRIPRWWSGCCSACSTRSSPRPAPGRAPAPTTVADLLDVFFHGLAAR